MRDAAGSEAKKCIAVGRAQMNSRTKKVHMAVLIRVVMRADVHSPTAG